MSGQQPGWHDDPSGVSGVFRWWDGDRWTRWLSRDPAAALPDALPPEPAAPAPPAPAPAAGSESTPATAAASSGEPQVRLPVALAVLVGALVVAVVGVGAVVAASAEQLPSGTAVAPPPPGKTSAVAFDPGTRVASVGELKLTLAEAPYVCASGAQPALPSLSTAVICNAPVHENYNAEGNDWSATVGVGLVPASLVVEDDLRGTGEKVFASLRGQFFSGDKTTLEKPAVQVTDIAPDQRSLVVSAEVHYDVPGLPSRYDRLLVLVVQLTDGTMVSVFSSRPDDTPKDTLAVLDACLATVTAR